MEGSVWKEEVGEALAIASAAADLLRTRSGGEDVREKGRADLVTQVDEESERLITSRIRTAFPNDEIVGEEFSGGHDPRGRRWIIDPIDGTVNFVHRHPFACVSIALVDDEGPAVGVINAPFLGEVFHAVRGEGAFLNGLPVHASAVSRGESSLIATGFPFKPGKGEPQAYFDLVEEVVLSTHGLRRAGSAALDLAYVACGRLDGYFELGLGRWDIAAGLLLVTEAGGLATGWRGDLQPPMATGRLLASNGRIHAWLEEVTAKYQDRL